MPIDFLSRVSLPLTLLTLCYLPNIQFGCLLFRVLSVKRFSALEITSLPHPSFDDDAATFKDTIHHLVPIRQYYFHLLCNLEHAILSVAFVVLCCP